jgi:DNA-binding response OmpR family regulator
MNVLIVDPDIEALGKVIDGLNLLIPDCKCSITHSANGCMSILKNNNNIDIVILDTCSIYSHALNLIREIYDESDAPVIVLSNDRSIDALVNTLDAGASDYIVKPFNNRIFAARLKAIVRRREWDIETLENKPVNKNEHIKYSIHYKRR